MTPDPDHFARTLVAGMPDAIVYADAAGLIRVWNAGATRMFGFSEQEALGQSLDIIIPASLHARHWQGYRETMRTGETRYGDGQILAVPAVRKDGVRISVEFTTRGRARPSRVTIPTAGDVLRATGSYGDVC